jgi:hypothetical protein
MAGAATVAAVALAAVLAWAAVAKAVRHQATVEVYAAMGLPAPAGLAVAVPLVEGATALGLIVRPVVGAVAALGLLAVFTAVIFGLLVSGRAVGCGCFGSTRSDPVGPSDILRNGMLAGLAALATGAARPTRPDAGPAVAVLAAVLAGVAILRLAAHPR